MSVSINCDKKTPISSTYLQCKSFVIIHSHGKINFLLQLHFFMIIENHIYEYSKQLPSTSMALCTFKTIPIERKSTSWVNQTKIKKWKLQTRFYWGCTAVWHIMSIFVLICHKTKTISQTTSKQKPQTVYMLKQKNRLENHQVVKSHVRCYLWTKLYWIDFKQTQKN